MKTWNRLFVRHGWLLEEKTENMFDCKNETKENLEFLFESLDEAEVRYSVKNEFLEIHSPVLSEEAWINVISFEHRGRGEGLWFEPGIEEPKVRELDTYISGFVRQLNRLGFYTMGSCDGHDRRSAHVMVTIEADINKLVEMLCAIGMKRVYYRESRSHYNVDLPLGRKQILDFAEKIGTIEKAWLDKGYEFMKEQLFYQLLEELLSIPGESGNEHLVRQFVKEKLPPFVDHICVDRHGNLFAERTYRNGNGPTILLNAHLDIAYELAEDRAIIKENGIWRSSEGILGADDRAGVAVLLHTAERLLNSSFSGKVKYIFTVNEESGLVGSRSVDEYFLWGIDAAIVIDRRGNHDIVTSCRGVIPFCEPSFGEVIEKIACDAGMDDWKCTMGGSSDTRIWAEHGIQSVNLSAGYGNEHTENEYLDVASCYRVTQLISAIFEKKQELHRIVRRIQQIDMISVKRGRL